MWFQGIINLILEQRGLSLFFFRYSFWSHLVPAHELIGIGNVPAMEYSVILLSLLVGLATVFCIYLPLRYLSRMGSHTPHATRWVVYFAGAGVGYLAIEVALLQKYGLFLGHPNYALSIVLAALLLATGVGSLLSGPIVKALGAVRFVSYVLAGVILVEWFLVLPRLPALIGLPLFIRSAFVFLLVAPIGVCLGVFMPSAVEMLKQRAPAFVPWAWGVNGIFSVLAPVAGIAFSMTWGINALLLSAVPIYLVVGLSLPEKT